MNKLNFNNLLPVEKLQYVNLALIESLRAKAHCSQQDSEWELKIWGLDTF
jgi:hypothetical protein